MQLSCIVTNLHSVSRRDKNFHSYKLWLSTDLEIIGTSKPVNYLQICSIRPFPAGAIFGPNASRHIFNVPSISSSRAFVAFQPVEVSLSVRQSSIRCAAADCSEVRSTFVDCSNILSARPAIRSARSQMRNDLRSTQVKQPVGEQIWRHRECMPNCRDRIGHCNKVAPRKAAALQRDPFRCCGLAAKVVCDQHPSIYIGIGWCPERVGEPQHYALQ